MASERRLLAQLAPELNEDTILRLVAAFQDLRQAYDAGILTYPYSLRGEFLCTVSGYISD
jgi:von Willebrand factor A domain-containing protein 8